MFTSSISPLPAAPSHATRRWRLPLSLLLPTCCALGACADDLAPADDDIALGGDGKVVTERNDDGSYTTRIDATAADAWTALELDRGGEVPPDDPSWDLAARRFHLSLGAGGTSGPAAVMALGDVALGDVQSASGDWLLDAEGDPALERGDGWYSYDPATHVVTPRPITYLLRTGEGALRALRIESYYDEAGTAARLRLRWKPVRAASLAVAGAAEVAQ